MNDPFFAWLGGLSFGLAIGEPDITGKIIFAIPAFVLTGGYLLSKR